jgi:hypothetical protein
MVGIVGILLLGSLAWSAIGALVSAVGSAGSALNSGRAAPSTLGPIVAVTPSPVVVVVAVTPTPVPATPAPELRAPEVLTPTPAAATPTPASAGRNPWVLLPQPEPGAHVAPGTLTVEARGRGDAPITAIRLELDGAALPVSLEQRNESTWRGVATARVGTGEHAARATVIDAEGRSGSFRWTFAAGP